MPEISLPTKATQDLIKTETDKIASKASQTTVDTINTKAGTNADAGGTTTLFARLKQIYDYLVSNLSSTRASKIDNLDTTITSRAAQTTANTINTNVGSNADGASATGSVHAKLKDIKSSLGGVGIKSVQRGTGIADLNYTNVTISSVNMSKTYINVQPYVRANADGGVTSTDAVMGELTSSTNIKISHKYNSSYTYVWEVIEFN